jgi:MYXO-CTERM domain-containing protein
MSRSAFGSLLLCVLLAAPRAASAFCGFYVASGDDKLFNDATQVVLMRDGTRTVLAMQNDYKGPPEAFALVVPVPAVLHDGDVKTLPKDVFDHVDKMGAPRLVEYWEQDPCGVEEYEKRRFELATAPAIAQGMGMGGSGDYGVTVEAQFVVGEYQVVILSATESTGLDAYLRANHYQIPDGAEPLLRPYVETGMKFFVAKVDPAKVKFENGHAALSPLRFYYDSDDFTLPIRLGLANSDGTQDLIVSIFARSQRYEIANYKNAFIPTNLDVDDAIRDHFAAFYAALFDDTVAKNPGAVVTEYAWQATTCDPCPGPQLRPDELMLLGADVLAGSNTEDTAPVPGQAKVQLGGVSGDTGGQSADAIDRVVRARAGIYRACYQKELNRTPTIAGKLVARFAIDKGAVTDAGVGASMGDADVDSCVVRNLRRLRFPAETTAKVIYTMTFSSGPPTGQASRHRSYPTMDFVLTRLHARYGKDIKDDLTFRKADPVTGGREVEMGGHLEETATAAGYNNFQARYAIRHEWTGSIKCENPLRGRWGGRPDGGYTGPIAAQQIAFAPRGQVTLANALVSHNHSWGEPRGSGSATLLPADSSHAAAGRPPPSSGCGCETSDSNGLLGSLTLAGLVAFAARPRRRRGR